MNDAVCVTHALAAKATKCERLKIAQLRTLANDPTADGLPVCERPKWGE